MPDGEWVTVDERFSLIEAETASALSRDGTSIKASAIKHHATREVSWGASSTAIAL
jgi:hypothetical protein